MSSRTLLRIGDATKELRISQQTLRHWESTNKIKVEHTKGGILNAE